MKEIIYPERKHPRLKYFDYSTPNYYFVTICTYEKVCIFGEPGNLNTYGKIAYKGLQEIPNKYQDVKVDQFVVMPNHIHAIIVLKNGNVNLESIIGQYKSFVTKHIRNLKPEMKVWQVSFHDHIIRNQKGYERIWLYIEGNPSKWEDDCFYTGKS